MKPGYYLLLLLVILAAGHKSCVHAAPSVRPAASSTQQQRQADAEQPPTSSIPRASAHLDNDSSEDVHHHGHSCGHSLVAHMQAESVRQFQEFARSKRVPMQHQASRRVAQSAQPGTIRINVQYQLTQSLSSAQQQAVQKVMDTAVRVVRKFVKVANPVQGALQVRMSAVCPPATIPSNLRAGRGGFAATDFVLLVTSQQSASCPQATTATQTAGVLAWAMACDYSLDSGRPTLGVINLCSGAVQAATAAVAAADSSGGVSGSSVDVLVHELMHALGLSAAMYPTWKGAGSSVSTSNGVSYLATAKARSAAQALLRCNQLPGVPLEDQGSAASATSHWEFRFFNQELMSPYLMSSSQRQRLSTVTLGALEDTGWYATRSKYAQQLDLEQLPAATLGCDLALGSCQSFQSQSPGAYYCSSPGVDAALTKGPEPKPSPGPGQGVGSRAAPGLQCFTPAAPAACDVTPFSNGCGVLHAAAVACSSSFVPPGAVNLLSNASGAAATSSGGGFYQGLGSYYGSGGICLPWSNSSGAAFPGCFDVPRCDNSSRPLVLAVLQGAVLEMPCAAGTSLLLKTYINVKDAGTTLTCPSTSQAAATCSPSAPGSCRGGGACLRGTCLQDGTCSCDLEYMGSDCSLHVSQVTDFDNPAVKSSFSSVSSGDPVSVSKLVTALVRTVDVASAAVTTTTAMADSGPDPVQEPVLPSLGLSNVEILLQP